MLHPDIAFGRRAHVLLERQHRDIYLHAMVWKRSGTTYLIAALVALSLAVSAFAHRAMPLDGALSTSANASPASVDLSAYRLPDGTLPSFCITPDSGEHGSDAACDFCTLAAGTALPASPDLPRPATLRLVSTGLALCDQISEGFVDRLRSVRAPPALS